MLVTGVGGYTGSLTATFSITLATPVLAELESSEEGILVNWTEIPGAEEYILSRASDDGAFQQLTIVAQGTVSYLDTDVTSGTLYRYRLVAVCGDVYSASSAEQQLQYLIAVTPTDPADTETEPETGDADTPEDGTSDTDADSEETGSASTESGDEAADSADTSDTSAETAADSSSAVTSLHTGDSSNLLLWCGALILSGGILAAAALFHFKRNRK